MNQPYRPLLLVVCCLVGGCFNVDDHLILEPDGSARVELTVTPTAQDQTAERLLRHAQGLQPALYPPWSAESAQLLFGPQATVTCTGKLGEVLHFQVRYPHLNALLASDYARAHQLKLEHANDRLLVTSVAGAQLLAHPEVLSLTKQPNVLSTHQRRVVWRVRLPVRIDPHVEATQDGGAIRTIDRQSLPDDDTFARRLATPQVVSCSFPADYPVPDPVHRLALGDFQAVPIGISACPPPPTDLLHQQARLTPLSIQVRFPDPQAKGPGQTLLSVHLRIPKPLQPMRWSGLHLESACDDLGHDLLIRERTAPTLELPGNDQVEPPSPLWVEQIFTGKLLPPAIASTRIRQITGHIQCHYARNLQVLALASVVPPLAGLPQSGQVNSGWQDLMDIPPLPLPHLQLAPLTIAKACVWPQGVSLQICSPEDQPRPNVDLLEAQAFDAQGRALPTWWRCRSLQTQISILGRPDGPLSLALIVGQPGDVVRLPIDLQQLLWRGGEGAQP